MVNSSEQVHQEAIHHLIELCSFIATQEAVHDFRTYGFHSFHGHAVRIINPQFIESLEKPSMRITDLVFHGFKTAAFMSFQETNGHVTTFSKNAETTRKQLHARDEELTSKQKTSSLSDEEKKEHASLKKQLGGEFKTVSEKDVDEARDIFEKLQAQQEKKEIEQFQEAFSFTAQNGPRLTLRGKKASDFTSKKEAELFFGDIINKLLEKLHEAQEEEKILEKRDQKRYEKKKEELQKLIDAFRIRKEEIIHEIKETEAAKSYGKAHS